MRAPASRHLRAVSLRLALSLSGVALAAELRLLLKCRIRRSTWLSLSPTQWESLCDFMLLRSLEVSDEPEAATEGVDSR